MTGFYYKSYINTTRRPVIGKPLTRDEYSTVHEHLFSGKSDALSASLAV